MTRDITFLDVETTGLDSSFHELLEFAAIRRYSDPSVAEQTWHFTLVVNEHKASSSAMQVNGYYDRQEELIQREVTPKHGATLAWEALNDATVVGNNVGFDLRFVKAFLRSVDGWGRDEPWYYSPLDLKAYVAGRCGMREAASTKLIAEVAGVPLPTDAHTALADARWNQRVYDSLTGR